MPSTNDRFKRGLDLVNQALAKLEELGLFVLSVDLNSSVPRVEVQRSPACENLSAVFGGYKNDANRRVLEMQTSMEGCQVFWQQAA